MKILSVEICNIQSLRGKHIIDFTQEPLKDAGLILLTGDTGAGKTTILDAITLALFERTNRHGKEKIAEKVISTDEKEAYVSVKFEVNEKIYTAEWKARIDEGKKKKKKQKEYVTETWFTDHQDESKSFKQKNTKSKAQEAILKVLKLDFEQFTRSVMLAQGEFAKFLKSASKDKAAILEKITNTQIYSQISIETFERHKAEKQKLENLQAQLQHISFLSEEEVQENKNQQKQLEAENKNLEKEINEISEKIQLFRQLEQVSNQILEWQQQEKELLTRQASIQKLQELCHWHEKTLPLHNQFSLLESYQTDFERKNSEIIRIAEHIQKAQESIAQEQAKQTQKETELQNFKPLKEKVSQIIQEKIIPAQNQIQHLSEEKKRVQEHLQRLEQDFKKNIQQAKIKWQKSETISENQEKNQIVEQKIDELGKLLESFSENELNQKIEREQNIAIELRNLRNLQEKENSHLQELQEKQNELQNAQNELVELQAQIQLAEEKKAFYQEKVNFENQKKNFSELRKELQEGKECPLCGSTHHPFAQNISFELSEAESKLKESEQLLKELQEKRVQNPSQTLRTLLERLEKELKNLQTEIQQKSKNLEKENIRLQNIEALIVEKENEVENQKQALQKLREWQAELNRQKTEQHILRIENQLLQENLKYENLDKNQREVAQKYQSAKDECRQIVPEIQFESYQELQEGLKKRQDVLEQTLGNIQEMLQQNLNKLTAFEAQKKQMEVDLANLSEKISIERSALEIAIREIGLQNLNELQSRILDEKTFRKYKTEVEDYEKKYTKIQSLLAEKIQEQKDLLAKVPANINLQDLENKKRDFDHKRSENQQKLGSISEKLASNEKNYQKHQELKKIIENQEIVVGKWEKLLKLIADPKDKFARVAQNITLEQLIQRANRHLQNLSDRYELQKYDKEEELSLCIVDRLQADTIREVSTLSGGETFLVSLALSLGLADMASRNVEIGMLFIDEGFGTLDANTLDTALNVLETLQNSGKTIVLISHLAEIKERIFTKISVEKTGKGFSRVVLPSGSFTKNVPEN
ncbi:AAA family ATPase [Raineya sp.]|jgi:exonuclease SbcC